MYVTVKNGTQAGRRRVYEARKEPWTCAGCGAENKAFYANCGECLKPIDRKG